MKKNWLKSKLIREMTLSLFNGKNNRKISKNNRPNKKYNKVKYSIKIIIGKIEMEICREEAIQAKEF